METDKFKTIQVYLSGKVTGLSHNEARDSFMCASYAAYKCFADEEFKGNMIRIVNPLSIPGEMKSWADYMLRDLMILKECDYIVMIPGWKESLGATIERLFAQACGIEVRYLGVDYNKDI